MVDLLRNKLPDFVANPNPDIYLGGNYVTLDFETTNLDKGSPLNPRNRIVSVAWRLGPDHRNRLGRSGSPIRYQRGNEFELADLVRDVEEADFIIAHNAGFELGWLERCGVDIGDILVYDTMLAEYVIGGNRWLMSRLSLERIAQRRYKEGKSTAVSLMIKAQVPVEDIPERWLEHYCKKDVALTHRLFLDQRRELAGLNLLPILYCRCLLTPVLVDIEKNGMQLDEQIVSEKIQTTEYAFARLEAELESLTGGINLNSKPQLTEFLYETLGFEERKKKVRGEWVKDRTPSNQAKTDADTITRLKATTARQREFLEKYREYKDLYNELTKYLRKFAVCCDEDGGLLLAGFNQTSTQTHRLSSTGRKYSTQLHNIPRAYKSLFRARRPGWVVGECDGAQLEFRVAAHLGRDTIALFDIVQGTDIHSVTASVIGCTRQEAKPHTFKPLYGGQSGTDNEKRYYQFFREKYTGITQTQQRWIDTVLDRKYLTTEWGLRYYWPNTRMDRSGYVTNTTSICNYPVQAFATAEIIPLALVCFWHRLRRSGLQMFIVNSVHDSIICEMPKEEIDAFHRLSKQTLIDDVYASLRKLYNIQFTVPLGAGVKVGSHWNGKDCADYVPADLQHDKGEVVYTAEKNLWDVSQSADSGV